MGWGELDQLLPLQTRVTVAADDEVDVQGDAARGGDLEDRLGHVID